MLRGKWRRLSIFYAVIPSRTLSSDAHFGGSLKMESLSFLFSSVASMMECQIFRQENRYVSRNLGKGIPKEKDELFFDQIRK